nr:condensation domain-containing protein [uncultured bacterium]
MSSDIKNVADLSPEEKRALLIRMLQEKAGRPQIYPLSFAQEGLWFLDRLQPGNAAYNLPAAFRCTGRLEVKALEQAFGEIVRRHETLRTTFGVEEGRPVQIVAARGAAELSLVNLQDLPEAEREAEVLRRAAGEGSRPFDLERGPLVRAKLLRLGEEEHVLLFTMHHIISDAWSIGILIKELATLYGAYVRGEESPLPELPVQYADYAAWQREHLRGEVLERQLLYWREQLRGAPATLELPTDSPRPPVQTTRGAQHRFEIPGPLFASLKSLCHRQAVTPYMLLLAAFQVLLARYTRQGDILVGTPVANRTQEETQELIGLFLNTLVLRADLSDDPTFIELLSRVREAALGAFQHQGAPFEKVVGELGVERDLSRSPVFQVLFSLQNAPAEAFKLPGLEISRLQVEKSTAQFDLMLFLWETGDGLMCSLEYNADLFERATAERIAAHYARLLEAAAADPGRRAGELPLLGEGERRQLLAQSRGQRADYPAGAHLHGLFEEQVRRTPDATALVFEGERLTYAELDGRADRLARRLRRTGVGPEALAAVLLERSVEMVVALLGVLKAGGAYVPLDPEYPAERVRFMLEDSGAPVVLTTSRLAGLVPGGHAARVVLLDVEDEVEAEARADSDGEVHGDNLAYVIYTSGSTGVPKGVGVTHAGICNRLFWMQKEYGLAGGERVLQKTPYGFDVSVWEFFWPLLTGATLVVARPGGHQDSDYLSELIAEQSITTLHFVPSMLRVFLESKKARRLASLRRVICSGEALPYDLQRRFFESFDAGLHNLYGPTEASVDVTAWACERDGGRTSVPIGRPISNIEIYVLDEGMQPAPTNVPGEIYIGGVGLARGYVKRPGLTAERFVSNPFGDEPGARLYRTGDLGRRGPDGAIEFLGRLDHQVKLRGHRIETGEIEAALGRHPGVREAVVVLREDRPGDKRLVAYVVEEDGAALNVGGLRSHLAETLPAYMIPQAFVTLGALPLSPNGKLDRRALPQPDAGRPELGQAYVAPRTPAEEALADVWREVLGVEQVGIYDNYFALGGDSIRSVQLLTLAQERGLDFTLQQLFKHQTIAGLVGELEAGAAPRGSFAPTAHFGLIAEEDRARMPESVEDAYPLSMLQAGMLFHSQFMGNSDVYHNVTSCHFRGRYDEAAFRAALQQMFEQHPVLRASFDFDGFSEPLQLVHKRVEIPVEFHDLRGLAADEQRRWLEECFEEEKGRKYDLTRAPLLRFQIHRRGDDTFHVTWTEHHAILDGWSVAAMIVELFRRYAAVCNHEPDPIEPPPAVAYRDFVALEREAVESEECRRYWADLMAGSSVTTLARWRAPRPAESVRRIHYHDVVIPPEFSDGLKRLARETNAPLKSVLLAAHLKTLSLLSGEADVVTGLVANGRPEWGHGQRLLGLFLNTMPLRAEVSGDSWAGLIRKAYEAEQEMLPFRRYPLPELQNVLDRRPLYESVFNFTHFHVYQGLLNLKGTEVIDIRAFQETNLTFIVNFSMDASTAQVRLRFDYDATEFADEQVEEIGVYYARTLRAMVEDPAGRCDSDYYLSADERRDLLKLSNQQRQVHPADECLHEWFERQARLTPDAQALICGGESLTYAQLAERAEGLARRLRRRGVGPESLVGLVCERSVEMVVALLGVLKAGGAYVPLDPRYPAERLRQMVEDSCPALVLCDAEWLGAAREAAEAAGVEVVSLDAGDEGDDAGDVGGGALVEAGPGNAAYVIYTSGSTGRPKGVVVTHGNVARLMEATQQWYEFGAEDVWTFFHSYAFDFSVWEMWGALLYGGRLVVVPYEVSREPGAFYELLGREGVTVLNQTPSAFRQLIEAEGQSGATRPLSLRHVIFGGEALDPRSLLPWFERHGDGRPRLVNMYGITETTVHVTYRPLTREDASASRGSVIGRPIPDLDVYVLDARGNPAPVGVPGELYVGGDGLARGYLHRPGLTAERFIPHPFGDEPGARLYRTGDWARLMPDGELEYLGRVDNQVKIRGFRIEPGEIEAELAEHPAVHEAVVVAREDTPGDKRLVAYVVPSPFEIFNASEVRAALVEKLPAYMVPTAFVVLDELPLTPSGKLNRRALPAPERGDTGGAAEYVAPRTEIEELLAGVWARLLKIERVGVHDDFFALGGHSVLATRMIAEVNKLFQVDVPLRAVFETPAMSSIAAEIEKARASGAGPQEPDIIPIARERRRVRRPAG